MYYLPLTLNSPAENLALDEALLDAAEAGEIDSGVLRVWESPTPCVVLGRSSSAAVEVDLAACGQAGVPVLRRSSGGGTILAGPGCLMYALVLDYQTYPHLRAIDAAHCFVLRQLAHFLTPLVQGVQTDGTSDLVFQPTVSAPRRKFSGNAMRCKRSHLLYHGTLLYDFDLPQIEHWLATPTRTPVYRGKRQHSEFVTNLPLERETIVKTLQLGWHAHLTLPAWPEQRTTDLVQTKYTDDPQWVIPTPST
jgi:lipoate-protein ligase A